MPSLLRSLKKFERWKQDTDAYSWITPDDFAADPLTDLVPDHGGRLSVFRIDDDPSLRRVLGAMIANRTDAEIKDYPYLLVDLSAVVDKGFELDRTPGRTPDEVVNTWHRDIARLSANKLFQLARVVWQERKLSELADWEARDFLKESISKGYIDRNKLNKGIQKALSKS